jgi:ABC-type Fe3+ transport system substrate-binding protein
VWAEPESVWFVQPGYKSPDDWQYVLSRLKPRTGHIVINTQLLAESDYPRSYRELASNPKYRGKIAYLDPSATSGGATDIADYCYVAKAATANNYWGIISGKDTLLLKEAGANKVAVAQGQRAIGLPVADASILELIKAGAPVKHLYFPGVPHSTQTGEMGVLSSAPHPNAALVFINWFLSKEGQNAVGPILEVSSIRRDVPSSVPDVLLGDIIGGGESKLFTQRQLQTQFTGDLQQSGVLKGLVDGTAEDEFVANYTKFVLGWESKYGGPQDQPLYLS